jgi:hypothetical protein
MLGIGCPDRHALPRITLSKMRRPRRVLPSRASGFVHRCQLDVRHSIGTLSRGDVLLQRRKVFPVIEEKCTGNGPVAGGRGSHGAYTCILGFWQGWQQLG